jgi:hypothetical protein
MRGARIAHDRFINTRFQIFGRAVDKQTYFLLDAPMKALDLTLGLGMTRLGPGMVNVI